MNYDEFKQTIKQTLELRLGAHTSLSIQEITKNNNTHFDGLTITQENLNISPTIYLNDYFSNYQSGVSLDDICDDILSVYRKNQPKRSIDISFFTDYNKIKQRIVFKLINYEKNKALLEKVPHFRYLDLAIVFHCLIDSTENGSATIQIYTHHLSYWNVTRDDLYDLAIQNTPRLLPYDLRNMTDVVKELLGASDDMDGLSWNTDCPYPMYVLTNTHKLHGSTCLLYENLLYQFATKLDADLFILPSSIHEVLLIPAFSHFSADELNAMVQEVNSTQLCADEILSDHVYYFSRKTRLLSIS